MEISKRTINILYTAKEKEILICGYISTQIQRDYNNLIKGDSVEVGYRAGCGKKDKTHNIFNEWVKLIKSIRKDGFTISEKNVTHANKSPTMAGGFWNSIIYTIEK